MGESSSELLSSPSAVVSLNAVTISLITVRNFSFGMSHSCIRLSTHAVIDSSMWMGHLFKGQHTAYHELTARNEAVSPFLGPRVSASRYSPGSGHFLFGFSSFIFIMFVNHIAYFSFLWNRQPLIYCLHHWNKVLIINRDCYPVPPIHFAMASSLVCSSLESLVYFEAEHLKYSTRMHYLVFAISGPSLSSFLPSYLFLLKMCVLFVAFLFQFEDSETLYLLTLACQLIF